jgi:hypothetical protein
VIDYSRRITMKLHSMKPIVIAIGMAFAGQGMAATLSTQGTIYMKFLDGNMNMNGPASMTGAGGDPGSDVGQVSELTLEVKAVISPQVTTGFTVMSRCCMKNYWTDYGFGSENSDLSSSKYLKLRAAFVDITPGYNWLSFARIGSNDWGQFDPFTVGKMRYTSRFNSDGFYFKGPLPRDSSWEFGRMSLPSYLGPNFNAGSSPQNAAYIGQIKTKVGGARLAFSAQSVKGYSPNGSDSNPFDGQKLINNFTNDVYMAKGEGSVAGVDIRGAYYHSSYTLDSTVGVGAFSPGLGAKQGDRSFKLDLEAANTPIEGLSIAYQYFNIGAGFVSLAGARRESDVLLTEGSEAAWFGWNGMTNWKDISGTGANNWHPVTSQASWNGGMVGGMHQVVGPADNGYMDFDEGGAEQVQGWRGNTVVVNYEAANTPMSLEVTHIGYNTNWQNYGGQQNVYGFQGAESTLGGNQPSYLALYHRNQDRKTDILAFKGDHIFHVLGGLETGFRYKRVKDVDHGDLTTTADDLETTDNGYSFTVGNQVVSDLYTSLSWGKYSRDITLGGVKFPNDKHITTLKTSYNLTGVEIGGLVQLIQGTGYRQLGEPIGTGSSGPIYANPIGAVQTLTKLDQYRMKVYLKSQF